MAEENTGLEATVSQGIPDKTVRVNDGVQVGHEGVEYDGGETVTLPGPTAIALISSGAVTEVEDPA